MYLLLFDKKALLNLEKLPNDIKNRIVEKLKKSKNNPHHYFKKLTKRKEYSLRVGEYRVIADINDSKIQILILLVDHRRRIYKKSID